MELGSDLGVKFHFNFHHKATTEIHWEHEFAETHIHQKELLIICGASLCRKGQKKLRKTFNMDDMEDRETWGTKSCELCAKKAGSE